MRELSKDELRALWETGVPLDSAWVEFAAYFDRFALRALKTDPDNDAVVLGLGNPRYQEISKGWLPPTLEGRQKKLVITTINERINLLGEVYRGQLWAIGFQTLASGSDDLVRVPRQFFYFDETGEQERPLEIYWGKGELNAGGVSFFDIHVVRAPFDPGEAIEASKTQKNDHSDAAMTIPPLTDQTFDLASFVAAQDITGSEIGASTATSHVDETAQAPKPRKPDRPTKREVIIAAIAEYAATDPQLEQPPAVRYRAYRSYISAHGYNVHTTRGFSIKTFEVYERAFRNMNK